MLLNKLKNKVIAVGLLLGLTIASIPTAQLQAASKLTLNLKENQTFFILPSAYDVTYDVNVTKGGNPDNMICTSTNQSVASIDNNGLITFHEGGTTKITVECDGKKASRNITVMNRTDWTKVIAITNQSKIPVKKNIATLKVRNLMSFPLKVTLRYNTYDKYGAVIGEGLEHAPLYLTKNGSFSMKEMYADNVSYIGIVDAKFEYKEYTSGTISQKNITIKESVRNSSATKKAKRLVETVTNKNKKTIILPYQIYLYDQNNKLMSISYDQLIVTKNQKKTVSSSYFIKKPELEQYVTKVVYKFQDAVPDCFD